MHSRESSVYLEQIVRYVDEIRQFTRGTTLEDFKRDLMCRYAVTYALQSMSEASRRLSEPVRGAHPEIPGTKYTLPGMYIGMSMLS